MVKINVFPKSPNALVIKHPTDGPLRAEGSSWEYDGFTARLLVDGEITTDDPEIQPPPPDVGEPQPPT
jgi:hypothetical protein